MRVTNKAYDKILTVSRNEYEVHVCSPMLLFELRFETPVARTAFDYYTILLFSCKLYMCIMCTYMYNLHNKSLYKC